MVENILESFVLIPLITYLLQVLRGEKDIEMLVLGDVIYQPNLLFV